MLVQMHSAEDGASELLTSRHDYIRRDARDVRMRRALGICISRVEDEVADHAAELEYIDARVDELLALILEKRSHIRELSARAWRLTARIESKGGANA